MDNKNKIHIWELPEKTDSIDKDNDYTIIHDGVELKKVLIKKLYDYFNQDYKIDNTVLFFETLMNKENVKYNELYESLENSIESYYNIIQLLSENFASNRDKIRELEMLTNQMNFDIESILKSFNNKSDEYFNLDKTIRELKSMISKLKRKYENVDENITKLNNPINTIEIDKSKIKSNNSEITKSLDEISEDINSQVIEKGESLLKNINEAYDRIVSIIDYYHHIHDTEII